MTEAWNYAKRHTNKPNIPPQFVYLILMSALYLLGSQFEMLGPLNSQLFLRFTLLTLQPEHNFPCCLSLLVKHGFGLTTETHLLRVVTAFSLGEVRCFTGFVLGYFHDLMLSTFFAGAECSAFFRDVYHDYSEIDRGATLLMKW